MTEPVTTGSGIERTVECRGSSVLPRMYRAGGQWARRGLSLHAYLERIASGMPAADSLLLVDEEHRPAAEAIDLPPLAEDLRLSPEVAFAYSPVTDTARLLGQSLERDYSSITEDEWPLTIDIAGLTTTAGIVRDWKTGHTKLARTRGNWQMRGAAIAVARTFERDEVDAQLIYLREGRPVWRDRASFDAFELAGIAAELGATHDRVRRDREAYAAGRDVPTAEGPWCRYCPSWGACPAKASLVRWALTGEADGRVVEARDLAAALERVRAGKKALEQIERTILAEVAEPLLVEVAPDGTETWLGEHEKQGNEKLNPSIVADVAADVLGVPADQRPALEGELFTVTKKAVEDAVKKRVPRGSGAPTVDQILSSVRARNGATRPTTKTVGLYQIRPRALASGE